VRAHQDRARAVANHIGEIFVMQPQRIHPLIGRIVGVAVQNVARGQRQQALGGFFQRAVEHHIHLAAQAVGGHGGGQRPSQQQPQTQPQRQPPLQALRPSHPPRPSR